MADRCGRERPEVRESLLWSAARNWGTRLASALSFFLLARIVPPNELGLFAAAASLIALAELFAENGIGDAVIQRASVDDRLLSAAMWLNIVLALALAVALLFARAPIERAFDAPGLSAILAVCLVAIVLNAFGYVPQAVLRRRHEFRWLAVRGLSASACGGGIGLSLALAGYGVWSLVAQFLATAAVNMVMVWQARPFRPSLVSPVAAAPLLPIGFRVFNSKVIDFINARGIEFVILAVAGTTSLAVYIMASRLAFVAMQMITAVSLDVALPAFCRTENRDELRRLFMRWLQNSILLNVPIFVFMAALAPEAMTVVFGRNGAGGAPILAAMALLSAFQVIYYLGNSLLVARGKPEWSLRIAVARLLLAGLAVILMRNESLEVIIWSYAAAHIGTSLLPLAVSARSLGVRLSSTLSANWAALASIAGAAGVALSLRPAVHTATDSALLTGGVLGVAVCGSYAALLSALRPKIVKAWLGSGLDLLRRGTT